MKAKIIFIICFLFFSAAAFYSQNIIGANYSLSDGSSNSPDIALTIAMTGINTTGTVINIVNFRKREKRSNNAPFGILSGLVQIIIGVAYIPRSA